MIEKLEAKKRRKHYNVLLWADGIRKLEYIAKMYDATQTAVFQEAINSLYQVVRKKTSKNCK